MESQPLTKWDNWDNHPNVIKYRLWNLRGWTSTNSWILSELDHSLDVKMKLHWRYHIIPHEHHLEIGGDSATRTPTINKKMALSRNLQKNRGLSLVIQDFFMDSCCLFNLQKSRGLSLVIQDFFMDSCGLFWNKKTLMQPVWENFKRLIETTSPLPSGNERWQIHHLARVGGDNWMSANNQ